MCFQSPKSHAGLCRHLPGDHSTPPLPAGHSEGREKRACGTRLETDYPCPWFGKQDTNKKQGWTARCLVSWFHQEGPYEEWSL